MNSNLFKTVFSKRLGALVAVGEHATSQGKATGGHGVGGFNLMGVLSAGGAYFIGPLVFSFALITLAWAAPANNALPSGGKVAQGAVAISQSGANMAINQSTARAVVNWQSFDIGKDAKVNIVQPNAQAVLLNRVTGVAPSQIFGQMSANGQVVLVNPNGVTFGKDGSVSAAGLTASTLNISDADFMAGRNRFTRDGATSEVVNQGTLTAAPGGYVALLGASVSNEGKIYAPQGNVALGAAEVITLPMTGTGRIKMELSPAAINAAVANQKGGSIVTEGGQVYMQAAAMGNAMASVLQSGSIDTSGAQGGAVHLLADGGTIKVDGSINANSTGKDDKGQTRKGGDIIIGRDEDTGVLARYTDVSGARLESQGGLVETSGDVLKSQEARVQAGEWLLDPFNITIAASGASGTVYNANYNAVLDSVILASDIANSLNAGTSVTLAGGTAGASAGNITVNASIAKTSGAAATLTLKAQNDIVLAANTTISSTSGALNVVLNSDVDGGGAGAIVMNSGSGITSLGGNITLGGGTAGTGASWARGNATNVNGITLTSATINAGGGNILMNGYGMSGAIVASGVNMNGSTISTTGAGTLQISGSAASTSNNSDGVFVNGTSITGGSTGTVTITGTASTTGPSGGNFHGVRLQSNGTSDALITSTGGNVSVTGTGGGASTGTGTFSYGISLASGLITAGGTGTVNVTGTGGSGTSGSNFGIALFSTSFTNGISSSGGAITVTGISDTVGSTSSGIRFYGTMKGGIFSSNNAPITLITDSLVIDSGAGVINAGTGTVTVKNRTGTTTVNVGGTGTDTLTGTTLGLDVSAAELGAITAGKIVVGRNDATGSGAVTVNALNMGAMGNTSASLSVLSSGNIAVNGAVTKTAGTDATLSLLANNNITVATNTTITGSSGMLNVLLNSDSDASGAGGIVFNTGSGVTSNGGNITLGGGSALNGSGVAVGDGGTSTKGIDLATAAFNAGGGNIAMTGTTWAAAPSAPAIQGINVNGGSIQTSGAGTIDLRGYNNTTTNTNGTGVSLSNTTVTGGSTGTVSIIGDARAATSTGNYIYGTALGTGAKVTSTGGNIAITGYGGNTGTGSSTSDIGVAISGGAVAGVGAGTVTITGTGGKGPTGNNWGVYTATTAGTSVTSQGGDINIIGTGGTGTGSVGILIGGGTVGVATGTTSANVILTSDSTQIQTATINSGTGTTTIQNKTAGTLINVGGNDVLNTTPLTLGISNAEMNLIKAGTLKIGSTTSGAMTTTAAVTTAATTGNVYLQSGSTLTASSAFTSGAGLLLQTAGGAISTTAALAGTNVSLDNTGGAINWSTGALTAGASSGSATNAVNIASSITATGNVNILGNVATTTNTGVNLTSAGSITSSGTAATINITSNGNLVNAAAIKDTGTTGTGSNINLTSTSGTITGAGAIGDTTNKNASVTFTQSGTSNYDGAINAANFTKAGTGALTLDSWALVAPATPVASNISNAYTVKAGSLTLAPGATYAQLNPASVNVENTSSFSISSAGNGWWKNTAFNFTGGLGGGTMNFGGNPIGATGTTNVFSTSGGATNTISGVFNANSANVNLNLTPATSGTTLLDGSFAALAFTQSAQAAFGLQGAGTVNMSGGGNLLIKDKVSATSFNINAGNVQVGDGTAATGSTTATLDATNLNIAAGTKLTFNRAEAYSNASVITGAGSLIQAGAGVVTLTGNSSAFAGATTVNAGKTLAIGTGGYLGAAGSTLTLTDSASNLSFTNTSGTSTVASTISGPGTVTENGAGGIGLLLANNTYTGITTTTAGTLQVGNGGTTGSLGTGSVTDNSALVFNRSDNITVSNAISGSGTVTQAGTGVLTFPQAGTGTVNNTYTGQTYVNAGTLSLKATSNTAQYGTGQFNIASGATLNFDVATGINTTAYTNTTFAGNGTLTKTGAGQVVWNTTAGTFNMGAGSLIDVQAGSFVGGSSSNEVWTNNLSSLNVASGALFYGSESNVRVDALTGAGTVATGWSTSGSITVGVNGTAAGTYNPTAGTATFSGDIKSTTSNTGVTSLSKVGAGTQILTGTNTYTGNTTISAGTLQIGDGGTTGTLGTGAVTDNASLVFNRSNAMTVANAISGTGTLTQAGTGTSILTGANSYAGTTTISAGTLQVGNGGTTGTLGTGAVVDNGNLTFNRSDAVLVSNTISGSGTLSQTGAGTTTLTADNTYAGTTSISGGTLQVGNAGTTGTLGAGSVTLSNNANLSYVRAADTTIANTISGTGNVSASITGAANNLTVANAISLTGGTVNLVTDANLSVTQAISTTNTSSSAIFLEAGKSTAAGTATGGDVTLSGSGALTAGTGARITIETGSVAGSTGLGVLPGNSRFNSDELTTNYNTTTAALGSGLFAIYRESPILTAAFINASKTYDAQAYSGNNGLTYTGYVNGDTNALVTTTTAGTSQGAKNAGTYTLTGTGTSDLGYTLLYTPGTLTVDKANLSLAGTRVYDAGTTFAGQYLTATGVAGETFTVAGSGDASNLATKNVQSAQSLSSLAGLSLGSSSNGGLSDNYNPLSATASSVSVTPKAATVSATATNLTYNAATQNQLAETTSGFIAGDAITVTGQASGKNAGSYASNLALTGTDLGNYSVTVNNASLVIDKAALTATGNSSTVTYNGNNQSVSGLTVTGLQGSDTAGSLSTLSASGATAKNAGTYSNVVSAGTETNYTITTVNGTLQIDKATLTATGNSGSVTYNGSTQSVSGLTVIGLQGSDTVSSLSTLSASGASAQNAGTYSNVVSAGTETNYIVNTVNGTLQIDKAILTATGNSGSFTYNGNTQSVNGFTVTGLQGSDQASSLASLNATGASGKNAGSYTNTVTAGTEANYTINTVNGSMQIGRADLVLSGTRVYDASKTFAGQYLTATGVAGETFTMTGTGDASNLASKNVQTNQVLSSLTGLSLGTSANGGLTGNYNALSTVASSVSVTPKSATVSATATNVTYNAATQNQLAETISGFIAGDSITVTGQVSGQNAGSYASNLAVSGADLGNYSITVNNANLVIGKAALTATGNSGTVTYNGADHSVSGLTVSGLLGSDTVSGLSTLSASGATGKNAGTYSNTVTAGTETNYTVTTVNGTLQIDKAALTATGNSGSVTYNGGTQSVTGFTVSGLQGSDTVASLASVSATGASGKNAGTYTNTVTAGTEANYTVTTTNGTLQIGKASLTATGNSGALTYNGADQSVSGFTVSGLLGSDTVSSLSSITAAGATGKNAGTYSNVVTAGTEANYTVSTANGTLQIGKAALTATGNSGSLTYNGADQSVSGFTVSGLLGSDTVASLSSVSAAGATGKNAGSYTNTVTAGTEANYTVTTANGTLQIGRADLVLSGTRVYDAGTSFAGQYLTATGVGGETFAITGTGSAGNLSSKNVQVQQALNSLAGLALGSSANGGLSSNYNTLSTVGSQVNVTPKSATVNATATSTTYNGTLQNQATETTSGFIAGDTVTVSGQASGKHAGTYVSSLAVGGTDASNYNVTLNNANLVIDKAALTVTATSVSKTYDGTLNASGTGTVGALAGAGDSVDSAGSQAFLDKNAGTGKTVRASGVTIKDAANADMSANYSITYVDDVSSVINKASLTVTANADARFVGRSDVAGYAGVSYTGLVAGETPGVLGGNLTINRTNASEGKAGNYSGVLAPSGLTSGNYDISYVNGDYTIVPADRLLVRTSNVTTTYGSAVTYETTAQYLDSNDDAIITLTRTGTGNNYTFNDGVGTTVNTVLKPYSGTSLAALSTSGNTVVGTYAIKDAAPTVTGGNFIGPMIFVGTLTVNTQEIAPTATNVSKVYDGTTAISNVLGMGGKVTGDVLSIGGSTAFASKNAGTGLAYTVSGITLSGADAANYHLAGGATTLTGNDGVITPAALKLTSSDVVKVYDRTTAAVGTALVTQGTQLYASDSITGGAFSFNDKNVGAGNKVVSVSAVTINDGNNGNNYTVTYIDNTTSTITPKSLTANYSAVSKTYDGNTLASVTGNSGDVISGDAVSLSNTAASFDNKNVGIGKTVTVTGIGLSGADAGNYSLQNSSATTTANVTAKNLTASYSATSKTYDGGVAASVAGSSTDIVSGDVVDFSNTSAVFADKNAGTAKSVAIAGIAIAGTDSGNYALQNTTANTIADITRKDVSLSSLSAANKVYDGTASASITAGSIATGVGSETLLVSGVGSFSDKNAAAGKTVTVSDVTTLSQSNGTGDWSNYRLTTTGALSTTADITPKAITLTGITAASKTYDGGTSATVSTASAVFNDKVSGDDLSVISTGSFADKTAATGKTVTLVNTLGGTDLGNYTVTDQASTTADITKKTISLSGITAANKTYDGNTSATVSTTNAVFNDQIAGDKLSVTSAGTFSDKTAATGKTVNLSNTLGGDDLANYTVTDQANTTADISKKAISLSGITAANKTYDGNTSATVSTASAVFNDQIAGDVLTVSSSGTFSDKTAATVKTVTLVNTLGGADLTNYTVTDQASTTADIAKKAISLSGITASNKTYDGSTSATVSTTGAVFNDQIAGDKLSVTSTGTFSDKNVAVGKTVALVNTLAGDDLGNYTVTDQASTTADIGKKAISLSGITAASKTYDGTVTATVSTTNAVFNDKVSGDDLSVLSTGSFSDKTAASGKTVNLTNTLSGLDLGNYSITDQTSTTADISKKAISLSGITAANKTYDGSSSATVSTASAVFNDQIAGDKLSVTSSGSFSDKNAATGKTVNLSNTLGGADLANYIVTDQVNTTADIAKRTISLSGITAASKTYDGTTAATVSTGSAFFNNKVSGDDLSVTSTGTFSDKTAATGKTVNLSNTLGGADLGNYTVTDQASTTADISKKAIGLSGITAANKTYDGNTSATVSTTGVVFNDQITGDVLTVTSTGTFSDKTAANGKTVNLVNTLGGTDLANYTVTDQASTTADITKKAISLSGITAANKTYDGNTSATVSTASAVFNDQVAGDKLSVTSTGTFSDKNAATGKTVNLSNTLSGDDLANYTVTDQASTTADISKKAISLSGITAASKTYDGNTTATMSTSSAVFNDKVSGDDLSVTSTGTFSDKTAAIGKTVTLVNTLGGADLGNYSVTEQLSTTADISKKAISLSGITAANKTYDGNTSATVSTTGVVFNDQITGDVLTVSSTGTFSDKTAANGKTVTLVNTLGGTDLGNYTITDQASTTADITKKTISLSGITAANKTYDGNNSATVSTTHAVFNDQIAGDKLSVTSTGTFSDKNAATGKTVNLSNTLGGDDLGNYTITDQASTTADIAKKTISLSGITAASKTYDGNTTATVFTANAVFNDQIAGDVLTVASTGTFSDKTAATGKTVTLVNTLGGTDLGNYSVTDQVSTTADISKKSISLSGITASNKTYDGSTSATVSTASAVFNDKVSGDDLSVLSTGTFSDKNVAVGKSVALVNTLGGADLANYTVTDQASTTADITKKAISLSGITAANKTYDGNTAATVSTAGAIFNDKVTGDDLTVNSTGTFSDKNAAAGKTVNLSNTLGGADLGNYTVTDQPSTLADIHKKSVILDNITAASKTYDGSATATILSGAISGTIAGESLAVSGTGSFSDKNVANDKTVTVSDVTALTQTNGSGDWNNYSLSTSGSMSTTAHITPKSVTLDSVVAAHKTYDGNTTASISSGVVSGTVAGETLSVIGTGVFADKNVATGIAVDVADVTALTKANGTGDWANYALTTTGAASTTANITKASLQAALTGTVEKTYDGTTTATNLNNSHFALTGWVGSEGASVTQVNGSYASKNVSDNSGTGTVSVTLATGDFTAASGTLLSNYQLPTSATGLVGKITPALLSVKVNDTTAFVTQDGNLAADKGLSYTGFVNGDTAATALTGSPTRTYSGATYPVAGVYANVYDLSAAPTANNGNYTVSVTKGQLTVVPADKLLIGIGGKTYTYGSLTGTTAGASADAVTAQYCLSSDCSVGSLVNLNMTALGNGNWQATDNTGTSVTFSTLIDSTGKLSTGGFVNVGNYTYNSSAITIAPSSNPNFVDRVVNGGVLTIDPKVLTLSAVDVSKVYDGSTSLLGRTLNTSGVMTADVVSASSTGGSFDSKNAGSRTYSFTGLGLSGTDASNYAIQVSTVTGTGSITPKDVTLTAASVSKTYNGNTTYTTTTADLDALTGQLIAGDTVSGATISYTDKNVSRDTSGTVLSNKTVTLDSVTLNDGNSGGNYTVTRLGNSNSTITPKTLAATDISAVQTTYGSPANTGAVTLTGLETGDVVNASASLVSAQNSSSGQLKAGSYFQTTDSTLTGSQAGNYSLPNFTTASTNYVVEKLALTGAAIAGVTTTYATAADAGAVSFTNVQGAVGSKDKVTSVASIVDANSSANISTSGNLKAGSYNQTATVISGDDAANYSFAGITTTDNNYVVNKLALTGAAIAGVTTTYATAADAGAVSFTNVQGAVGSKDKVTSVASIVDANSSANISTSGNLKAGSYNQTATVISGDDAANYSFAGITTTDNNYVVNKLALTGAAIAGVTTTYATAADAGAVSFTNVQGAVGSKDKVTSVASIVDASNAANISTSGNLKAGSYNQTATAISGDDAANYSFAGITTTDNNYVVNKLALTGAAIAGVTTTYATAADAGAVSFTNVQGAVGSKDKVTSVASIVDANSSANISTSGNLKAGSYNQTATAISGDDASNYSFAGITTTDKNYVVNKLALNGAAIADVTTTYGTTANTGAVTFTNVIDSDVVTPATATLVTPGYSTSNNLKAGSYAQNVTGSLTGTDADNYSFTGLTTTSNNYTVNKLALTGAAIADVTTTYGTIAANGAVTFRNVIAGDVVTPAGSILVAAAQSSSGNLKAGNYAQNVIGNLSGADGDNYSFGGMTTTSNNYVVKKRELTGAAIANVSTTYGTYAANGAVTFDNVLGSDVVTPAAVTLVDAATSSSGNLKAGSYAQNVIGTLTGTDADNYSFSGMTTSTPNYVVKKLALTGAAIADAATVYGTTTPTGAVSFGNVLGADQVYADTATLVNPAFSSSNKLKAGSYAQSVTGTLTGTDADNYSFGGMTTSSNNYVVSKLALTGAAIADVGTTYGTSAATGAVSFGNVIGTDVVTPATATLVTPGYSSSNQLKAGSYAQSVTGALTGTDADNYSFGGMTTSSSNYVVSKLALTGAAIADVGTTYGTSAATGGVTFGNVIGTDVVTPATATLVTPSYSSSNNLKAGSYAQSVTGALTGTDADNYSFNGMTTTGTNYVVNKLALKDAAIADVTTTYGTPISTGAVSFTNVISGDVITPAEATLVFPSVASLLRSRSLPIAPAGSANYSTSGNLKAGSYAQSVTGMLTGADADNYSFEGLTTSSANYTVNKLALTGAAIAGASTTYGSPIVTGAVSFGNVLTNDVVTPATATLVAPGYSSSNTLKVGNYIQTVVGTLTGADADNYSFGGFTACCTADRYVVTPKTLVVKVDALDKVYDSNNLASLSQMRSAEIVGADKVNFANTSVVFDNKNVTRDASGQVINKMVTVRGLSISGDDAANYVLDSTTLTGLAKITPKPATVNGTATEVMFNGLLQWQQPATTQGFITGDDIQLNGLATGLDIGTYTSRLNALGNDVNNYAVVVNNNQLAITPAPSSAPVLSATTASLANSANPVNPSNSASAMASHVSYLGYTTTSSQTGSATSGVSLPAPYTTTSMTCSVANMDACLCQVTSISSVEFCQPTNSK
ncbi:hypothetical protein B9Z51_00360 [Limnohabitans sp. T6-5]|uniref:YDG domain-containing protein n=1 Tax=Limnohabitans sp. T6-5 TaxID=1100724 RepID=UPI000D356D08|nr:YDG domain-containing protein [Limnohabitans sp. T6-5]PUE10844.1 hypothetical protein B9Z51_00360 [Limnohabitans sp. T6-5]